MELKSVDRELLERVTGTPWNRKFRTVSVTTVEFAALLDAARSEGPVSTSGEGKGEYGLPGPRTDDLCGSRDEATVGATAALAGPEDVRENWELTDEFGWATPDEVEQAIAILSQNNGDLAYKIQGCFARGGAFSAPVDGDGNLASCAREAGWALSENVDRLPWERRGRVATIVQRLGAALLVYPDDGGEAVHSPDEGEGSRDEPSSLRVLLEEKAEEIARVIGDVMGHRSWETMAEDRQALRQEMRVNDKFDINEPTRDECRDTALAIIAKLTGESDER